MTDATTNPEATAAAPLQAVPGDASAGPTPAPASPTYAPHTETATLLEQAVVGTETGEAKAAEVAAPVADALPSDQPPPAADAEKPAEAKPADAKPAEEVKPAEPAPLQPVAYEYAVPETLKLNDATKTALHTALDAFRTDPAKGAQGLIDLHNTQMQAFAGATLENQHKVFADTRKAWQNEVLADPELGGAHHRTAMGVAARMRDMVVRPEERASFDDFLRITGAGDHPWMNRMLYRMGKFFDEPSMPSDAAKPPPNIGAKPNQRVRDMYKSRQTAS